MWNRRSRRSQESSASRCLQPEPLPQPSAEPEEVDDQTGLTWELIRRRLIELGNQRGEWAGVPLMIRHLPLELETRYPYYDKLNGECLEPQKKSEQEELADQLFEVLYRVRNTFHCTRRNCQVTIIEKQDPLVEERHRKVEHVVEPCWGGPALRLQLHTLEAADAWSVDAEARALLRLQKLVTPRHFRQYLLTGSFLEQSRKSRVWYMFRKLRPTVAMSASDETRILTCLCLHPIGHYRESWAGVQTPTDDVLAHLLLMRGCEEKLWARANHIPIEAVQAGL